MLTEALPSARPGAPIGVASPELQPAPGLGQVP